MTSLTKETEVSEERVRELRDRQYKPVLNTPRPTIEELEKILQRGDVLVEIQPNGEVRAVDYSDRQLVVAICDLAIERLRERESGRGDATRLQHARDAATYAAWRDMLSKFSEEQRRQVAMLLAHDWLITGVTLSHDDGRLFHMDAKDYWPPYFSGVKPVPAPIAPSGDVQRYALDKDRVGMVPDATGNWVQITDYWTACIERDAPKPSMDVKQADSSGMGERPIELVEDQVRRLCNRLTSDDPDFDDCDEASRMLRWLADKYHKHISALSQAEPAEDEIIWWLRDDDAPPGEYWTLSGDGKVTRNVLHRNYFGRGHWSHGDGNAEGSVKYFAHITPPSANAPHAPDEGGR